MGEFLFWIILIPVLFYIMLDIFSKDTHPRDMEIEVIKDEYGDE